MCAGGRGAGCFMRARAVQLLGSISEMSLRSQADILKQGWSLCCTKAGSLQNGWKSPLHRYFTSLPLSSVCVVWRLVFTLDADE